MSVPIEFAVRGARSNAADDLREYARHRVSVAMRPFAHRLRRVVVRVVDENGPRRGVDSRCSLIAERIDGGRLFVEATAAWPFAAVRQAAGRLAEALRRSGVVRMQRPR